MLPVVFRLTAGHVRTPRKICCPSSGQGSRYLRLGCRIPERSLVEIRLQGEHARKGPARAAGVREILPYGVADRQRP
jgi:hypothetical protein